MVLLICIANKGKQITGSKKEKTKQEAMKEAKGEKEVILVVCRHWKTILALLLGSARNGAS